MILSFMGEFQPPIEEGTKYLTLRDDPARRWRSGKYDIQMYAPGGPRNGGKFFRKVDRTHVVVYEFSGKITPDGILLAGVEGDIGFDRIRHTDEFVLADGFKSLQDFAAYHVPGFVIGTGDARIQKRLIVWDLDKFFELL